MRLDVLARKYLTRCETERRKEASELPLVALRVKPFSPGSQSAAKSFIRSFICKLIRVQTQYDNDPFRTRHECWKVIRDWNKKTRDFLTREMRGIAVEFFGETYIDQ